MIIAEPSSGSDFTDVFYQLFDIVYFLAPCFSFFGVFYLVGARNMAHKAQKKVG